MSQVINTVTDLCVITVTLTGGNHDSYGVCMSLVSWIAALFVFRWTSFKLEMFILRWHQPSENSKRISSFVASKPRKWPALSNIYLSACSPQSSLIAVSNTESLVSYLTSTMQIHSVSPHFTCLTVGAAHSVHCFTCALPVCCDRGCCHNMRSWPLWRRWPLSPSLAAVLQWSNYCAEIRTSQIRPNNRGLRWLSSDCFSNRTASEKLIMNHTCNPMCL